MKVEVAVVSKEVIKPSSPTPNHLRHYQLSFLDRVIPAFYTSLVLFYELNDQTQPTIAKISEHLKKSLAEVLTLFYPLAGRVKLHKHFVDCNDEGIPYLEARVSNNCRLADVVNSPMADELNKLIPFESTDHVANELAFGVQLNIFECGGIAIGFSTSHKLGDGLSMLMFAKNWAAIARGQHDHNEDQMKIERPEFVSASLFPPKESTGLFDPYTAVTKTKVTKRFVFDATTIDDLRAKYASTVENDQKRLSRVVVLWAFIQRRIMEATKDDDNTLHMVVHTLNLRPKFDPPLPRSSFGNIFHNFLTTCSLSSNSSGDDQETCHDMVRQVGEEINKIDQDYLTRIQHGDEYLSFTDRLIRSYTRSVKVVLSSCSSLCRFPLYENDFGWGRPTWVGVAPLPAKNLIVLVDTKEVGGIEAYVSLADQDAMIKFESDALLQRRVGKNRVGSAGSNLTHQPATLSQVWNSHTGIDQVHVQVHAKL